MTEYIRSIELIKQHNLNTHGLTIPDHTANIILLRMAKWKPLKGKITKTEHININNQDIITVTTTETTYNLIITTQNNTMVAKQLDINTNVNEEPDIVALTAQMDTPIEDDTA